MKRNELGQTLEEFLEAYDETLYRRPSNTVDMILMTVSEGMLKILLVKRKNHPFIGDWALPGGFIDFDEDMEEAVRRELQEETNISEDTYFRQLYTLGNHDRDPRTRIISTAYLSMTPESNIKKTKAGDDASEAKWFTIQKIVEDINQVGRTTKLSLTCDDISIVYEVIDTAKNNYVETRSNLLSSSNAQLAGDHIKVINMAMDQIQQRVASTGILFNLLPKECTLREIQTAYEAVVGHKVDTGNFRRDIRKMLKDTGHKKKVKGKDVSLYTFNPMVQYLEERL